MTDVLLEVRELKKYFPVTRGFLKRIVGWVKAVDGVSFRVAPGEIFGLVGESGCGKSTLGKTILGLYPPTAGKVCFEGRTISGLPPDDARRMRRDIQYVYQDPGASLDPWWTVGRSIREPLLVHMSLSRPEIRKRVEAMITAVGLEPHHLHRYPHEFSGGQQRRLALARTLVLNPRLIIFDEPTAGLDVSVQATILRFFKQMQAQFDLTYIFISHDLGIVRLMCDHVTVMYLGAIVESGPTEAIFQAPTHPSIRRPCWPPSQRRRSVHGRGRCWRVSRHDQIIFPRAVASACAAPMCRTIPVRAANRPSSLSPLDTWLRATSLTHLPWWLALAHSIDLHQEDP